MEHNRGQVYTPAEQTYGRDANSILREVMQVGERPEEIRQLLAEFYEAVDGEKIQDAERLLEQVEELVGDSDPEINGARVTLDFEKMRDVGRKFRGDYADIKNTETPLK